METASRHSPDHQAKIRVHPSNVARYATGFANCRPPKCADGLLGLDARGSGRESGSAGVEGEANLGRTSTEGFTVAIHPDRLKELAGIVGTTVAALLGEATPRRSASTPGGRLGQSFAAIGKLPRRQQGKILDVVEALLAQQGAVAS
jgi:hypothetical protein